MLYLKILLQVLAVGMAVLAGLLDYVTHDKRTRKFKRNRSLLFIFSGAFLLGSIVLLIADERADQAEKMALNAELVKARQPVRDIYVSFRLLVPLTHPALERWARDLRREVNAAFLRGSKESLYVSRRTPDGQPVRLGLKNDGPVFPKMETYPVAHFLLNYAGLRLNFYAEGNTDYEHEDSSDLYLPVFAIVDGKSMHYQGVEAASASAMIGYDVTCECVDIMATDWPIPSRTWRSNGKIQSVPELEESTLLVSFWGYMLTNHQVAKRHLDELRDTIAITEVRLNVGGRHFVFRDDALVPIADSTGKVSYLVEVAKAET